MQKSELYLMSDEELRALSLKKIKNGPRKGCATPAALKAQSILFARANKPFHSGARWKRDHSIVEKI
ncbi:MAG: hypothetical protein HFJ55_02435 [Clostridia bacterium]|nr:hypothetical protein [Clostridia bacterium]